MKYTITERVEVGRTYEVEADSADDAIDSILAGEVEPTEENEHENGTGFEVRDENGLNPFDEDYEENCEEEVNKYGVPYHLYVITLEGGAEINVDVGCEEDWGNVQQAYDGKNDEDIVAWGNVDEWERIVKVIDSKTQCEIDPLEWAEDEVWCYAEDYSK